MMTKRQKRKSSAYRLLVEPAVHAQRRALPGNVRQRIKQAITALADDPRPHDSRGLDISPLRDQVNVPAGIEVRRLRLEHWRVVYIVDEEWQTVTVLAIRRRPPYDYQDLGELIARLQ
jgi:mRNA interferase RelE/StbE